MNQPDPVARFTIRDLIDHTARHFADASALLSSNGRTLSHSRLAALRLTRVAELRAAGLSPADRVAVALPKSADAAALSLILASACCCVPLNPDSTAAELRATLARTRCGWLVAAPGSMAWECGQALGLNCVSVESQPEGGFSFRALPRRAAQPTTLEPGEDDTALLLQTSGSTAVPKLVPLSHRQLLSSASNLVHSLALVPQDRCLNMMPLFHVGGLVDLLLAPLSVGGSVIVTERTASQEFFTALRGLAPTWYQGVPTMLREILSLAQLDPQRLASGQLRFIRSVSSALPERLQREIENVFDCPVVAIYGMTETAGVITSNPLPPGVAKPGSVGICAGPQVRIRCPNGSWAQPGESGEICVRGETVIGDYETSDIPREDHFQGAWLSTGDLGHLDAQGYLFLDGRIKDIINRGGEKIAPLEIDQCLLDHPQIVDAAAFGTPHPTLGEEVALAVVTVSGGDLDEAAIREFLGERLAAHKLPRHIHFLDALPLGRTGKLQRSELSARFGAASPEPAWQAPETPNAQRLADIWQRTLRTERVGMDDDFFDLGGDSLTAVSFMADLQALTGTRLPAGALYDHPTLRSFLGYLQALPQSAELSTFLSNYVSDNGLPPTIDSELQRQMHGWRGVRTHPHALLVGHRLEQPLLPLFWAVNSHAELEATLSHLDPQRPVYGMRSLYGLTGDSVANRRRLGQHLAREIAALQPTGPLLIGGFCAGGRVALEIADALKALGREVGLLCLLDTKVHRTYASAVLLLHTRRLSLGPKGRRLDTTRGYIRYFGNRVCRVRLKLRHAEALGRRARHFGPRLGRALRRYEAGQLAWLPAPAALAPVLPDAACRAHIQCHLPADRPPGWLPGSRVTLRVTVRNTGNEIWLPTERSGLILGASLRRTRAPGTAEPRGQRRLDGCCALPVALGPGDSVDLELRLRIPLRTRRYVLQLDLLDDGVAWFGDRGSTPFQVLVHVAIGSGLKAAARRWWAIS